MNKTTSLLLGIVFCCKSELLFLFFPGCKIWTKSPSYSWPIFIWRVPSRQKGLHLDLNWRCMFLRDNRMLTECLIVQKPHADAFWFCPMRVTGWWSGRRRNGELGLRMPSAFSQDLFLLKMKFLLSLSLACKSLLILTSCTETLSQCVCQAVVECFVFKDLELPFLHLSWL